jgi:hypothetical protein
MPGPAYPGAAAWLVLVYRLPASPPALKAMIRRRLTGVGAVYLSPAVTAVPSSAAAERGLRRVQHVVTDAGGSAVLLRGEPIGGPAEITAALNEARDREYQDIVAGCREAVTAFEALTTAGDYRYEQLWDHDAGLKQLTARHTAIRERDTLGAGQARVAASALAGYRAVLDEYARHVYAADAASRPLPPPRRAVFPPHPPGMKTGAQRRRGSPSNAELPPTVPARSDGGG